MEDALPEPTPHILRRAPRKADANTAAGRLGVVYITWTLLGSGQTRLLQRPGQRHAESGREVGAGQRKLTSVTGFLKKVGKCGLRLYQHGLTTTELCVFV